jgi:hypothetical protein
LIDNEGPGDKQELMRTYLRMLDINVGLEALKTQHSTLKIDIYPNPGRGKSDFRFLISDFGRVTIKIFDVHGREIATIIDKKLPAGEHSVSWDAEGLPSGIYYYRLQSGNQTGTGKIILLK